MLFHFFLLKKDYCCFT